MTKLEASGPATIARPSLGPPPVTRVPRPDRWYLANGLKVVTVPWRTMPQVAARLVFPAGSVADPDGVPGLAAFVGSMLTEGSNRSSADELNERLDRLGASLGVQVGHDFAEVDLFMLSETLAEGFSLLAEVVRFPDFPDAETERVRAETLDALAARDDEPANVADDLLASEIFGSDHPYGLPALGSDEGVAAVTRDGMRAFHAARYRPHGAVLVVAGDFATDALRDAIEESFGGWEGRATTPGYPPFTRYPGDAGEACRVARPDSAQGELRFGARGMPRTSDDWIPGAVTNYLLGGSTITGRLGANLREDKGWTYGVRSAFTAAVQSGGWIIETAVEAEVVDEAITEVVTEIRRLIDEPVPEEELRRAKDALILSLPRVFETPGRIVGRFSALEAYGLPEDYWERFPEAVERTSAEDVRRIASTYFSPERLRRVVVGPA